MLLHVSTRRNLAWNCPGPFFHYWRRTLSRRDKPLTVPMPELARAAAAFVAVLVETQPHALPSKPDAVSHGAGFILSFYTPASF